MEVLTPIICDSGVRIEDGQDSKHMPLKCEGCQ